ncbi:hypothetical protein ROZALSC1DRAFT_30382 [Rozella allomycis CSF55]|uniref:Uncharacterized protein n=1 Tax=Rozella allomycis (strain CSF55) TaxID=988480 RepID=A0A4P9YHW5_ROZAC|nr:hypothetical protein ROZALSC1DRAFT_30382 [Rozella allomycis CSF55]
MKSYKFIDQAAPSATMKTTGHLFQSSEQSDGVAPNNYDVVLPKSSKAASLKGRYKESKSNKYYVVCKAFTANPSPATYIVNESAIYATKRFTLTARNIPYQDTSKEVSKLPSPCSYNANFNTIQRRQPASALSGKPKETKNDALDNPAPNAYNPNPTPTMRSSPKVSIKSKHFLPPDSIPGPGDYDIVKPIVSRRLIEKIEKMETNSKPRKKLEDTWTAPGPADYVPLNKLGQCGPKYSFGTKTKEIQNTYTPSAADYTPLKPFKDTRRITFKGRHSPYVMVFPTQRVDSIRVSE